MPRLVSEPGLGSTGQGLETDDPWKRGKELTFRVVVKVIPGILFVFFLRHTKVCHLVLYSFHLQTGDPDLSVFVSSPGVVSPPVRVAHMLHLLTKTLLPH